MIDSNHSVEKVCKLFLYNTKDMFERDLHINMTIKNNIYDNN